MVAQRGTILMASGTEADPDKKHLFVVMTAPSPYPNEHLLDAIVMAPICSANGRFDATCTLFPGDHPFIRHESFVKYSFSVIKSAAGVDAGIQAGDFKIRAEMSVDVFARIYQGLLVSRRAPFDVQEFVRSLNPQ